MTFPPPMSTAWPVPVDVELGRPLAVAESGELFSHAVLVSRCGNDEEEPYCACRGAHGGKRFDTALGGDVGHAAMRLLFDRGGAVGVVVRDHGLIPGKERVDLVKVGVLLRLVAMPLGGMVVPSHTVVGIDEHGIAIGGRSERGIEPSLPTFETLGPIGDGEGPERERRSERHGFWRQRTATLKPSNASRRF